MNQIYNKIHLIIPYYNGRNYLRETVQSILNQSSPNWLLTIIDDCGNEDESAYIDSIHDKRINYLRHKKNHGIVYNFNLATQIAKTPLHTITGPDDRLLPLYVERALEIFNKYPNIAYYQPNVYVIDERGDRYLPIGDRVKRFLRQSITKGQKRTFVTDDCFLASIMNGDWFYAPAMILNQNNITNTKQFNTERDFILDFEEYSLAILRGDSFFIDDQFLFEYRRHKSSYSMRPEKISIRFRQESDFYNQIIELTKGKKEWRKTSLAAKVRITSRLNRLLFNLNFN